MRIAIVSSFLLGSMSVAHAAQPSHVKHKAPNGLQRLAYRSIVRPVLSLKIGLNNFKWSRWKHRQYKVTRALFTIRETSDLEQQAP